jgi:4-amino-4-deoxy-L-arabinose transferase-like glycosyltransferase
MRRAWAAWKRRSAPIEAFARRLSPRPLISWILGGVFLGALVYFHIPSLNQKLLELHSFRQTQTAWTALIFHQQGIDLFHSKLPVLGPPWELPFEFPLFQAIASQVMNFLPTDPAMRVTGLAFFVVTAIVTWRLVARLAGEVTGLVCLIVFSTSGLALLWSRTSMIEYFVTAASVGGLYFLIRWHERATWRWYALAMFVGIIAMLVKPTTAVLYLPAILVLGLTTWRAKDRVFHSMRRYWIEIGAVIAVPLAFGQAWTMWADSIKAAQQFTADQTSAALWTWNYGTIAQRMDPGTWDLIGQRLHDLVFGGLPLVWTALAIFGCLWLPRYRAFALTWVLSAALGPLVFINLYWVHDYYLIALSPMAAAGIAFGFRWLLVEWRFVVPAILAAALAVSWVVGIKDSQHYWGIQFWQTGGGEDHAEAAAYIDARSQSTDLVVVTGREGWIPATLYYAQRWGLMLTGSPDDSLAQALGPLLPYERATGYKYVFDCPVYTPCIAAYDITTNPPTKLPDIPTGQILPAPPTNPSPAETRE